MPPLSNSYKAMDLGILADVPPLSESPEKSSSEQSHPVCTGTRTDEPFRFLDLPAELRNAIYEMALDKTAIACLLPQPKTASDKHAGTLKPEVRLLVENLSSTSPLAQVNQQIRSEVQEMALSCATELRTRVYDFDFTRVIAFLEELRKSRLDQENSGSKRPGPWKFVVDVGFSDAYNVYRRRFHPGLDKWLKYLKGQNNKNLEHEFDYTVRQSIKFRMKKFSGLSADFGGERAFEFMMLENRLYRQHAAKLRFWF